MHKILQSVWTFDHTTTELDENRFTFPCITKKMPDQPLQFEGLTALAKSDDKAKGYSNNKKLSDKEEARNANIDAILIDISLDLERSVSDAEIMENHIIDWLPHYAKAKDMHRSKTTLYHARLVSSMAFKHEFLYNSHNLATYHAPPVIATLVDQISLYYGHVSFEEKHLIHVDHVQMKIHCLDALIDVILREKKTLEMDINNLCKKEKKRQKSIKTLREIWKSKLEAISKRSCLNVVPSKTIQNKAKKKLSVENLKTFKIDSSFISNQLARNWPSQGEEKAFFFNADVDMEDVAKFANFQGWQTTVP